MVKNGVESTMKKRCILCGADAGMFFSEPGKKYYRCGQCSAVFLGREYHISEEDEKRRYQKHNNDVGDPGYRRFVEPVVSTIARTLSAGSKGLDFGAGPGPVAAKLLIDRGYTVELYDPFFWDDSSKLEDKYDFVICSEVAEHFRRPAKEFALLRSLLRPGGVLFCMTELYSEKTDFRTWHYRNDPTHVIFYHKDTLAWIRANFGFSRLKSEGRLARFFT